MTFFTSSPNHELSCPFPWNCSTTWHLCDFRNTLTQTGTFHRRRRQLTHRKDQTASGDQMRDSEDSKYIGQVSKEAGFSAEVGKGQFFVPRPSIMNKRRWTVVCRGHTLPRSNPQSELVCALKDMCVFVQSWIQRQRICQDHPSSFEILILSKHTFHTCSWVLISRGLSQYASQMLDLEHFVAEQEGASAQFRRSPHKRTSNDALQTFQKTRCRCSVHISPEDCT